MDRSFVGRKLQDREKFCRSEVTERGRSFASQKLQRKRERCDRGFLSGSTPVLVKGVRVIQGFDKNEFGKVILVGPGSRACHVLLHSIFLTGFWHQGVTAVQLE